MLRDISRRIPVDKRRTGRRRESGDGKERGERCVYKGNADGVPSRSFTPSGAYTLPPQPRSREPHDTMPSPRILHLPLLALVFENERENMYIITQMRVIPDKYRRNKRMEK